MRPGKGIGRKVGHVKGREVFLKAGEAFEPEYERACEEAIDEMINAI